MPYEDGNARFTTVLLKPLPDWWCERYYRFYIIKRFLIPIIQKSFPAVEMRKLVL